MQTQPTYINPIVNQTNTQNNQIKKYDLTGFFRTYPRYFLCPYCSCVTATRVERSCNVPLVICGIISPLFCGLKQMIHNKDINCYNSKHYCAKCNSYIAEYSAC